MNTPSGLRRLIFCLALSVCAAGSLIAQQPPSVLQVAEAKQPCVLLTNDNVLFGHARQVGQWVLVRTGQGGEVQLPREEVACWAGSPRDLYRYRVDHRQKGDLAARLRDAEWCLRYELYDLAADPGEERDLAAEQPEQLSELLRAMDAADEPSPRWRFPEG